MRGLGTDIVEIERITEAIKKREKFKKRVFTTDEIDYCEQHKEPWSYYAARFAAKEATVKALGTGFRGFKWNDIEIVKDQLGKPAVKLHNQAQKIAEKLEIKEILISISHSRDYAVAQAIAIGRD
ncbi:holo-ACP synthase [Natroniella sulfidigena]|uniref:holo-ACP synthase n=1 Tax=Natroniella sulfidigena TaxID=723921 RepID=UPI00200A0A88|nr:holo-ACP synthase [Natroniella sulfidigena]MCK8816146.1 holo-ACP synthase [Natroniella sulfidigena]